MVTLAARMARAWLVVGRTFGARAAPALTAVLFVALRAAVALGQLLDAILFPSFRRTQVVAPVVIVGNPRTGTTLVHRFLHDHGVGAGVELWRMVYPSLALQALLHPLLPLFERVNPARFHAKEVHETGLRSVETDAAALFLRFFDGFFLYGFLLAFDEPDLKDGFDPAHRDPSERDFAFLRGLWRRNLAATGATRPVAKLFSLGPRLPRFLEAFPDARVLYLVRDPLEAIPSALSLVTGVLEARFGFWRLDEALRQRFIERLYAGLVQLLRRFHDDWASGRVARDRVRIVRYDRLMRAFDDELRDVLAFLGVEPDARLAAAVRAQADKQRAWKSGHRYDLGRFGLDPDRVRSDCAFVYEAFLGGAPPPSPPATADRFSAVVAAKGQA